MKKQVLIVVGLLTLGSANICMTRAQPPQAVPLSSAPIEAQLKVQRAEASAQIMSFATETMRSQLTPAEFERWPLALRDGMPYWLEYQPFEFWSPELQAFTAGKLRALTADAKVETFEPTAKNKAAVTRWLQEKAPFENAQLRFFLGIRFGVNVKNQDGALQLSTGQYVELTGRDTRRIVALGRLMGSLSPEQKSELFANNMHLPIARLSQEQMQIFNEHFGGNEPELGGVPTNQYPKTEIAIDFQFAALIQRVIADKKENFEVRIARPFDYLAD